MQSRKRRVCRASQTGAGADGAHAEHEVTPASNSNVNSRRDRRPLRVRSELGASGGAVAVNPHRVELANDSEPGRNSCPR